MKDVLTPLDVSSKSVSLTLRDFAFVAHDVLIPNNLLPYEFDKGLVLDRANDVELQKIKDAIPRLIAQPGAIRKFSKYEYLGEADPETGGLQLSKPLAPEDWRYYVVRCDKIDQRMTALDYASRVSALPLHLTTLYFQGNGATGWNLTATSKDLAASFQVDYPTASPGLLCDIKSAYEVIVAGFSNQGPIAGQHRLFDAFKMLSDVDVLPTNSKFTVLGLMAIIELLITHPSSKEDRGDSISHQIRTKLNLLFKRFDHPLEMSHYFDKADDPKKIWSELYAYRSKVAHGSKVDLNGTKHIKSTQSANDFLHLTVKALIRNYMREPQLYTDLIEC